MPDSNPLPPVEDKFEPYKSRTACIGRAVKWTLAAVILGLLLWLALK